MRGRSEFRLELGPHVVVLTRVDAISALRAGARPERSLEARALLGLRGRLAAGDSLALRWLRETVDLSFDPLGFETGSRSGSAGGQFGFAVDRLLSLLETAVAARRVTVAVEQPITIPDPPPRDPISFPPPPRMVESKDTFFDVRFVDETGQAINGLDVAFDVGGEPQDVRTNPAGVALLDPASSFSASVTVPDPAALEKILDPRWKKFRPGKPPTGPNNVEVTFDGDPLPDVPLKAAVEHTVIIKPPPGKLFVQLFDKTGRVRHANRDYTIDGPMKLAGKTNDQGVLLHEPVFPGDYTLSLTLTFFDDEEKETDVFESPLVVLSPSEVEPEVRRLGAVPRAELVRLRMVFNTSKAFLLPTAMQRMAELRDVYRANASSKLLVVGHADTAGSSDYNDGLALDRAKATLAFLEDDVDTWLSFYDSGTDAKKRWGAPEDRMMLVSMPDFATKPEGEDAVHWYQRTRHLEVDSKAGPATRRALVGEYMALDGSSLSEEELMIEPLVHGCGENFPLSDGGDDADPAPEDGKKDPTDRRVELFFFDPEFGIVPAPSGETSAAGSTDYPGWLALAEEIHDLDVGTAGPKTVFVETPDALFRTNSAVPLPDGVAPAGAPGEDTDAGDDADASAEPPTMAGVTATALRFNDEHPGRKVLVAGHTDTEGTKDFNLTLSRERARCTLALLMGGDDGRSAFQDVCDKRHTTADIKQILAWAARTIPGFDCDPGAIDDDASTLAEPVRGFQSSYNAGKDGLGATGSDLAVDGDVGPATWGAFFDCYEFALRQDLKKDAAGVATLRESVSFVDDEQRALGFGEFFPVEELGVDDYRSQANRRADILFYRAGDEPDTAHAADDPETSEIYLPGFYEMKSANYGGGSGKGEYVVVTDFRKDELTDGEFDVLLSLTPAAGPRMTRSVRRDGEDNQGFLDVRFKNLSTEDAYTLVAKVGDEEEDVVFADVPYEDLSAGGEPSGQLLAATDSSEPQPQDPVAAA